MQRQFMDHGYRFLTLNNSLLLSILEVYLYWSIRTTQEVKDISHSCKMHHWRAGAGVVNSFCDRHHQTINAFLLR
ncbi:hypothetical protein VNO77_05123 [Canavalia gladiata]|uniref:Uncharacterized protein n=1 Tax=Canavalia gladiata TaxID=3824 RepID=A0AAN9N2W4_CANGL